MKFILDLYRSTTLASLNVPWLYGAWVFDTTPESVLRQIWREGNRIYEETPKARSAIVGHEAERS